jgi:nitrite reductase/ring-hydroxylating ferredoxin subunit
MPFVNVAEVADIPVGKGVRIERDGTALAVFNAGGGRFFATSPLCPHEEGPLAEGWLEGDVVVCPWHGYDFELATGRCRVDDDLAVAVYPVRVRGTTIEVDIP